MGLTFRLGQLPTSLFTDASNNVGIGAAPSGSYKLEVTGTGRFTSSLLVGGNITQNINDGGINLYKADGTTLKVVIGNLNGTTTDEGYLALYKTNSETVRVRASGTSYFNGGNVGIGTSSPNQKLSIANPACIVDITSTTSTQFNGLELKNGGGSFYLGQDNSTGGFYGSNAAYAASLYVSGAYPMIMFTNGTERMRITSAGQIYTSNAPVGDWSMRVIGSSSTSNSYGLKVLGGTNSSDLAFSVTPQNGSVNYIYVRGDGYLYSASAWSGSDRRLKENITDLDNGLDKVLNLKPRKFDFIDSFKNQFGFIAQEVQDVIPDAVSVFQEEDQMLAIKMDFIVPHLVKAIQEQNQIIQELNERLNKAGL